MSLSTLMRLGPSHGGVVSGGAATSGLSRVVASSRQSQQSSSYGHPHPSSSRGHAQQQLTRGARKSTAAVGRSTAPPVVEAPGHQALQPGLDLLAQPLDHAFGLEESNGSHMVLSQSTGQLNSTAPQHIEGLPGCLAALLDPHAPMLLPAPGSLDPAELDNSRLDRLVASLGRGKATWQRALQLYAWLKTSGHALDDRLCTTLIRVCADHGDALAALGVYEWMAAPLGVGGAGLRPTAYTYTAVMRAAAGCGMLDRAMQVWGDSQAAGLQPDCRLCITYIEVCMRLGLTDKALQMYASMRDSGPGSAMRPTAHAYTAAMRAATEGGRWIRALAIWEDMRRAGCAPTGHAYAAAISACSVGQDWARAVALFDDMTSRAGIRPDVVSCTALVTALASAGEADKAEALVGWMVAAGLKPNVRTYTALLTAMGNARQWGRAVQLLAAMQQPEASVAPNAYTYSALLKAAGAHGQWRLAEAVFEDLEGQVLVARSATPSPGESARLHAAHARLAVIATSAEQAQGSSGSRSALLGGLSALTSSTSGMFGLGQGVPGSSLVSASQQQQGSQQQQQQQQPPLTEVDIMKLVQQAKQQKVSQQAQTVRQIQGGSAHNWSHPSQLNGLQLDLDLSGDVSASSTRSMSGSGPGTPGNTSLLHSNFSSMPSLLGSANATPTWPQSPALPSLQPWESSLGGGYAGSTWQPLGLGQGLAGSPADWSAAASLSGQGQGELESAPQPQAGGGAFSLFSAQLVRSRASLDASNGVKGPRTSLEGKGSTSSSQTRSTPTTAPSVRRAPPSSAPPSIEQAHSNARPPRAAPSASSSWGASAFAGGGSGAGATAHAPLVNEVVCGLLMLAYERAGKWVEAVGVLGRARALGVEPNSSMFNTAISAAGRAGQMGIAEQLFQATPAPDVVTHESLMAAYGMVGCPDKAEALLRLMAQRGLRPRDYTYTALITAHSVAGDAGAALGVGRRMQREGFQLTVHVYNALLGAAQRAQAWDVALELLVGMKRDGVEPNALTQQLMATVGRRGAQTVEGQQLTAAALSAVFAAAGGLLMRAGMF